jgi:formiminotetrahydrofolate cyclodeaminase
LFSQDWNARTALDSDYKTMFNMKMRHAAMQQAASYAASTPYTSTTWAKEIMQRRKNMQKQWRGSGDLLFL